MAENFFPQVRLFPQRECGIIFTLFSCSFVFFPFFFLFYVGILLFLLLADSFMCVQVFVYRCHPPTCVYIHIGVSCRFFCCTFVSLLYIVLITTSLSLHGNVLFFEGNLQKITAKPLNMMLFVAPSCNSQRLTLKKTTKEKKIIPFLLFNSFFPFFLSFYDFFFFPSFISCCSTVFVSVSLLLEGNYQEFFSKKQKRILHLSVICKETENWRNNRRGKKKNK